MEEDKIEFAGFWIRFIASFIDGILFGFIYGVIFYIYLKLSNGQPINLDIVQLINTTLTMVIVVYLWKSWNGQTPGKKLMGIKVVSGKNDLGKLTTGQAILRYLGYFLSSIIFCLGFIMVAFRKDKRGLHDLIANTYVIYDQTN